MKKLLLLALLMGAQGAWQETDGTLDFACGNGKENFTFKAYYNDQATDLELAYDIAVMQFPFIGSEINPFPQPIPGCQKAPLEFMPTATGAEIYFECLADGDAGFGEIKADFSTAKMELTITFPEGQPNLLYPYEEDTSFTLPCTFLD